MSHADRMIAAAQGRLAAAREAGNRHEMRLQETEIARWTRVRAHVDSAPPLSAEVRDRLAVLLRVEPASPAPRQRAAVAEAA